MSTPHKSKAAKAAMSSSTPATVPPTSLPGIPANAAKDPTSVSSFVPVLSDLFKPHVESFNFVVGGGINDHEQQQGAATGAAKPAGAAQELMPGLTQCGLDLAVADLKVMQIDERPEAGHPSLTVWIERVEIGYPTKAGDDAADARLMPSECRELGISYCAPLMVTFHRRVGGGPVEVLKRRMGVIPVMLKSARCHLQHLSRAQLLAKHEEADEQGGTFIVNGIDRLIRLLIVPRRHYPTALNRPAFGKRGAEYSNLAVQMRCVKPDQSSKTITLHYLHNGGINLRFSHRKQEYFIPVVLLLKALCDVSDREIYDHIVAGQSSNAFLTDRVELMLRAGHVLNFAAPAAIGTRRRILEYLGKSFRIVLRPEASVRDEDIGRELLSDVLFVHCNAANGARDAGASESAVNQRKFDVMIHMIQKLYALAQGSIKQDNPDALHCQEILLPGHMYLMILKEKLEECLLGLKQTVLTDMRLHPSKVQLSKELYFRKLLDAQKDIGRALHYFLVTGNLVSSSGLDMMQVSGYTIVAEKLNYFRYLSHFRSVHRGQFFTTMKTTEVRKLLPESFGFFCPAHTPDGSPCGLLNHLTNIATIQTHPSPISLASTSQALLSLGMLASASFPPGSLPSSHYVSVLLDGVVVGKVSLSDAPLFLAQVRLLKNQHHAAISRFMEIYAILDTTDGLFPAITLYTTPQRVLRPVRALVGGSDAEAFNNWASKNPPVSGGGYAGPGYLEWIGSQEQITMEIAIRPEDFRMQETTHMELSPTSMFSVVASMTPFSDFNQSPRNMYQCLSGDHDVLTESGWRSIVDVSVGTRVLVADTATLAHRWEAVTAKLDQPHDGTWYALKSNQMDALCTPEHRWLVANTNKPTAWRYVTVQDAIDGKLTGDAHGQWDQDAHRTERVPLTGVNMAPLYEFAECAWLPASVRSVEALNLDFCRLIGLVLGDGGVEHSEQHSYSTTLQQRVAKHGAVKYMEGVLSRLETAAPDVFTYTVSHDTQGKNVYRFASRAVYDFFLPMMHGAIGFDPLSPAAVKAYDHSAAYRALADGATVDCTVPAGALHLRRWLYYAWRSRLSRDQARALIEGFMAADGEWADVVKAQVGDAADGRGIKRRADGVATLSSSAEPLIHSGHVRGFNSSLPLINDLAAVALLANGRPKIGVQHKKGNVDPCGAIAPVTCWSLTVSLDEEECIAALPRPVATKYAGRKYCITVPAGNFMARRRAAWDDEDALQDGGAAPFFTGNCQMGKQTMGTPFHSFLHRIDNKVFRIQNPQSPLVRNENYIKYSVDNYPLGTNAVVAVISYTGYDMEDAMIINKSAYERGFMHGSVYKYKCIDLSDKRTRGEPIHHRFGNVATEADKLKAATKHARDHAGHGHHSHGKKGAGAALVEPRLGADGLPVIGSFVQPGEPLYATQDDVRGTTRVENLKEVEPAYIEDVRLLGDPSQPELQKIGIKYRINRNPVIGDKFASRAGQKGVMSVLYPTESMPFTESGLTPDIIINPHAFPSRMTIGMLIESMAGKSGCLNGVFQNGTPFQFSETNRALDHFGAQLRESGYSYVGSEPMYSGIGGGELRADIFIGVVYYQRLRHMVSDKSQVRATGPVNSLTRQPIKGRKVHGGIRFGEMERDSLLGHGTAFLLHDRLMNCSDYHTGFVCTSCGSVLSPAPKPSQTGPAGGPRGKAAPVVCRSCDTAQHVATIAIPYVFMYLANELAAMNIKITLQCGK